MATYKISKCPYCKISIKFLERTYWNDYTNDIGEPLAQCPNCKKNYKTGKQKWDNIPPKKRIIIWIKVISGLLVSPIYIIAILYLVFAAFSLIFESIKQLETFLENNFGWIYLTFFVLWSYVGLKNFKLVIDENRK